MTTESFKGKIATTPNLIRVKLYLRLFFVIAILFIIAIWMDYWIRGELGVGEKIIKIARGRWGTGVLVMGGLIYILLLSIPFVPGVELGVLLMCAFGREGIVFIYFATVIGLSLAFFMGRIVPKRWIESLLRKLGLSQTGENISDVVVSMLDNFLNQKKWLKTLLLNYRYLVIGILLNIPGSYLIGGGGGISLVCGINRNISFKWFLLTVILSVSPVPLLAFFGVIQLEAFF